MAIIKFDTSEATSFLKSLGVRIEKNLDSKKALIESSRLLDH